MNKYRLVPDDDNSFIIKPFKAYEKQIKKILADKKITDEEKYRKYVHVMESEKLKALPKLQWNPKTDSSSTQTGPIMTHSSAQSDSITDSIPKNARDNALALFSELEGIEEFDYTNKGKVAVVGGHEVGSLPNLLLAFSTPGAGNINEEGVEDIMDIMAIHHLDSSLIINPALKKQYLKAQATLFKSKLRTASHSGSLKNIDKAGTQSGSGWLKFGKKYKWHN